MKNAIIGLVLSAWFSAGAAAAADAAVAGGDRSYTPFMLSLVAPLQVPPRSFDVGGLRLSLVYGECRDFDGLDLGTVGRATGHGTGFQAALLANIVEGGGFGLQAAPVNLAKGDYAGHQVGVVNIGERAKALQIGFYNGADDFEGVQIGVINITRRMYGVQLGLFNVIQDNDVKFLPLFNGYF